MNGSNSCRLYAAMRGRGTLLRGPYYAACNQKLPNQIWKLVYVWAHNSRQNSTRSSVHDKASCLRPISPAEQFVQYFPWNSTLSRRYLCCISSEMVYASYSTPAHSDCLWFASLAVSPIVWGRIVCGLALSIAIKYTSLILFRCVGRSLAHFRSQFFLPCYGIRQSTFCDAINLICDSLDVRMQRAMHSRWVHSIADCALANCKLFTMQLNGLFIVSIDWITSAGKGQNQFDGVRFSLFSMHAIGCCWCMLRNDLHLQ